MIKHSKNKNDSPFRVPEYYFEDKWTQLHNIHKDVKQVVKRDQLKKRPLNKIWLGIAAAVIGITSCWYVFTYFQKDRRTDSTQENTYMSYLITNIDEIDIDSLMLMTADIENMDKNSHEFQTFDSTLEIYIEDLDPEELLLLLN